MQKAVRNLVLIAGVIMAVGGCGQDTEQGVKQGVEQTKESDVAEPQMGREEVHQGVDQTKEYDITETQMGCDEAHQITRRALERLYYKVADAPPTTDTGSTIKGQRMGSWGEPEPVSVEISCTADGVHLAPRAAIPPCEQANRVMRKAVEKVGYAVTTFEPATLGGVGRIRGEKPEQEPLDLTIACEVERNRVIIDTSSESPLMAAGGGFYDAFSDFQRGFYAMFRAVVDEFAYRQSPHYQAQVANMDQVQIGVVPLIPADIQRQFGDPLTELLPVRITVFNSTTNAYLLETDNIVLLADSGQRVKPAAASEHALPQPPLANQTLTPGAYVEGYLFYPAGEYTGARGFLIEQKHQEREGFSLLF
jgi:hypothetical protein